MSERPKRGIGREGLEEAFDVEEVKKSNLILQAHLLKAYRKYDEAAPKLAEAAVIEERLANICEAKGLTEKSWVHRFSASCCWAQAGNLYDSIRIGDEMLARSDIPERLRQRIDQHVQTLRRRRDRNSTRRATSTAKA